RAGGPALRGRPGPARAIPGQPERGPGRLGRAVRRHRPRAGPDAAPRAARPTGAAPALDARGPGPGRGRAAPVPQRRGVLPVNPFTSAEIATCQRLVSMALAE